MNQRITGTRNSALILDNGMLCRTLPKSPGVHCEASQKNFSSSYLENANPAAISNSPHGNLKKIASPEFRQKVLQTTDSITELRTFGVVLAIDGEAAVLREPPNTTVQSQYALIEIETSAPKVSGMEVLSEGAMAAMNCTAAVVAGIVTFGGGAAAPFTGGASLMVSAVAGAATLATAASCLNSGARTFNAITSPGTNQRLDDMPAYTTTLQVLDGISLLGVGASVIAARRALMVLKNAGVTIPSALKGTVNRQETARLTKEMIKLRRPNVSNSEIKKLIRNGAEIKRYSRQEISVGALKSIEESFSAGLSFISSNFDGNLKEVRIYLLDLES